MSHIEVNDRLHIEYGSPTVTKTAHEILVAARALLADPAHWTQEAFARTPTGRTIGAECANAVCFCALGALFHVGGNTPAGWDAAKALSTAARAEYGPRSIIEVNDELGYPETIRCFDAAIEETRPCP